MVLMSDRRIATHPHYEDSAIRAKIYETYHWAAYRRLQDVHAIMTRHNITHVVDTPHLCYADPRETPSYAEMIEEGEYGRPAPALPHAAVSACRAARKPNKYFKLLAKVADQTSPDERTRFWLYQVVPQP